MINKLVAFDFDDTLIHTPKPTTGKDEWESKTGLSWAGRGWWGNPESLNTKIFYPVVNQWVYNQFLKYQSDDNAYTFIATGRLEKLKNHVQKILDLHDISCDLYCNNRGETFRFKTSLFRDLMNKYPSAKELIIYDDRQEHLVRFNEWARMQPFRVSIIDVVNKRIIH